MLDSSHKLGLSMSENQTLSVLTLEQAAKLLHLHPVTLQRKARRGEVPAVKPGRCWVFLEIDLVEFLRAQYPSRVMQGAHDEVKLCRSTNVGTFGGTSSAVKTRCRGRPKTDPHIGVVPIQN